MATLDKLQRSARHRDLIGRADRILVAVSGGPDSVALLQVLNSLRGELGLHLEVAHLQHGLRGEEATQDAQFTAVLAEKLNLPFHLRELDLPRMKRDAGGGNLEGLARAERYRFFADIVRERNLRKVATAHTLDDQAETALMWFFRGTGLRGLGGMAALSEMSLSGGQTLVVIRPFLDLTKAEILEYLEGQSLSFRTDSTNRDSRLLRNWLRLELLPALQGHFGSRLPRRLVQQAGIFRDEDAVLDELARRRFAATATGEGLDRKTLLEQPRAVQRRILRLWIENRRGHSRGLEFIHIEDGLRLISGEPPQGRVAIPGGWELVREYNRLQLEKQFRGRRPVCYHYPFAIGTLLVIPEAGLEFYSEEVAAPCPVPEDSFEAVFDAACLNGPLSVRNFRRGDRFQPLGMQGHKKVKDLFIEKRVPLSVRGRWPLLLAGDEVLWIPGYGRSGAAPVSAATNFTWRIAARAMQG